PVQELLKSAFDINALANITGVGLDNILCVLPENCAIELELWDVSEPFRVVQEPMKMTWNDMYKTLHCGLSMSMIVSENDRDRVIDKLNSLGVQAWYLGDVISSATGPSWNFRNGKDLNG